MANILQTSPLANYLSHQDEIDEAIKNALLGGRYIRGPQVTAFEKEFADYLGIHEVIGVGSGTDALEMALRAAEVGPGDYVITVSHTAVATVAAIELVGAIPILVDIQMKDGLMDPNSFAQILREQGNKEIKAVIPVHLYGHPADMPRISSIAEAHGIKVIEDCAQAHGASIGNRKVGTWGDLAAFSFYPTKNLGALGDGGAVAANQPKVSEKIRLLCEYGWRDRYISEIPGGNSRLDEIQAAILRVKLKWLDVENRRRQQLAEFYSENLSRISEISIPEKHCPGHVYHQYVIRSKARDELRKWLSDRGIGTLIHYPVPVHRQPAYAGRILCPEGGLPKTECYCSEILSLPMYPQLTNDQVNEVIAAIISFYEKQSR